MFRFPNQLSKEQFLAEYWQQKPLYMPAAWQNFDNPISPEELAGLALESEFPSRIVQQHSKTHWSVQQGPFTAEDFSKLDGKTWSLLITDIEKHLPDFMQYVQAFRFIPDWRFDDLMISYAPTGGSVGPHIDDYDVFLLQTRGNRQWQIESHKRDPQDLSDTLPDIDLRLIANYQPTQTFVCKPGDILYLPPRLGHYGISQSDDCMTWSFGFRSPNFHNMMIDYLDYFQQNNQHKRYQDIAPNYPDHAGEIDQNSIQQIKNWLQQQINEDNESFADWLGRFLSSGNSEEKTPAGVEPLPLGEIRIEPNPMYKFFYIQQASGYTLYCNGESYPVSKALAQALCGKQPTTITINKPQDQHSLQQLVAENKVFIDHLT